MRYMIIERFREGPAPVYRRFRDRGRLAPEGLRYLDSWVTTDLASCYQIMECDDPRLLEQWMAQWADLVDFDVIPVVTSAEAASMVDSASQSERSACPACGFRTRSVAYFGSYEVCRVCGFEDDGMQLANPACRGGANADSLIEAQAKALALFPLDEPGPAGCPRDPAWRPLSSAEIDAAVRERDARCWKNEAVSDPSAAYWNRSLGDGH